MLDAETAVAQLNDDSDVDQRAAANDRLNLSYIETLNAVHAAQRRVTDAVTTHRLSLLQRCVGERRHRRLLARLASQYDEISDTYDAV